MGGRGNAVPWFHGSCTFTRVLGYAAGITVFGRSGYRGVNTSNRGEVGALARSSAEGDGASRGAGATPGRVRRSALRAPRDLQAEHAALAVRAAHRHLAAVKRHDVLHDRQSE